MKKALCVAACTALLLGLAGCTASASEDLMADIRPAAVDTRAPDETFTAGAADFGLRLFRESLNVGENRNALISPLSMLNLLALAANGASGNTLAQLEAVISPEDGPTLSIDVYNEYLSTYLRGLPQEEKASLIFANAIWLRDDPDLRVERSFLQTNADYYGTDAYKAPFDASTVRDMNAWVKRATDGQIDKLLTEPPDDDVMLYLINALSFDAEWETIYERQQVTTGTFTAADGTREDAQMMHSIESLYLTDGETVGFLKPYAGGRYAFAALLPPEGTDIRDYIAGLTGERFLAAIQGAESAVVQAQLPKFEHACSYSMKEPLKAMGVTDAFGPRADFTRLGRYGNNGLLLSTVMHKTTITVDERGTKAGAVSAAQIDGGSAPPDKIYTVTLDRPFVYAIVDTETALPLFLGAVFSIADE